MAMRELEPSDEGNVSERICVWGRMVGYLDLEFDAHRKPHGAAAAWIAVPMWVGPQEMPRQTVWASNLALVE